LPGAKPEDYLTFLPGCYFKWDQKGCTGIKSYSFFSERWERDNAAGFFNDPFRPMNSARSQVNDWLNCQYEETQPLSANSGL
jgi:hypothetical protein